MKKKASAVGVLIIAVLMVAPVMGSVNLSAGKPVTIDRTQYADGWPLPPLPPNQTGATLTADGWPLPPLPPNSQQVVTVA